MLLSYIEVGVINFIYEEFIDMFLFALYIEYYVTLMFLYVSYSSLYWICCLIMYLYGIIIIHNIYLRTYDIYIELLIYMKVYIPIYIYIYVNIYIYIYILWWHFQLYFHLSKFNTCIKLNNQRIYGIINEIIIIYIIIWLVKLLTFHFVVLRSSLWHSNIIIAYVNCFIFI